MNTLCSYKFYIIIAVLCITTLNKISLHQGRRSSVAKWQSASLGIRTVSLPRDAPADRVCYTHDATSHCPSEKSAREETQ